MRKLSPDEFAQLPIKGKGRSSVIFSSLINLKEGEGLLIEQKDWNRKAAPSSLIRYIEKRYKMNFTFGALANGEGWAVQRLKEMKKEKAQPAQEKPVVEPNKESANEKLIAELTLYYLGRITANKIERIDDTVKAAQTHYWNEDREFVEKQIRQIIEGLSKQGHIIIENEKTYLPLKRT